MKVGIVSAQSSEASTLRRILRQGDHEVLWIAEHSTDAIEKCTSQPPEVLLLSVRNEVGESVTSVRRIMQKAPCPILLLASSISDQAAVIFEALGAGATDVVNLTGADGAEVPGAADALETKLAMFRKLTPGKLETKKNNAKESGGAVEKLLLLGASAGGPSALATVLAGLPENFAAPVIIVQHIDEQFVGGMAEWLAQHCKLPVRIAPDQERMQNSVVYIAGRSEHLVLRDRTMLAYEPEPRNHAYKPSIDVMMMSAAKFWKNDAVAVLLTGMGQDGAAGLKKLREAGALTITQDKATSVVYGIPKAAAKIGAAVEVLPLNEIAARIKTAIPSPVRA